MEGILQTQHDFNVALKDHWHVSTKPGSPTSASPVLQLKGAATNLRLFQKSKPSLKLNRTNLNNLRQNYLKDTGQAWILSRYNKVN